MAKARKRGIYRQRRAIKPTGHLLVDQILMRARTKNTSLRELDLTVGRGNYFGTGRHRAKHKDPINLAMAVAALGGNLRALFPGPIEWSAIGPAPKTRR